MARPLARHLLGPAALPTFFTAAALAQRPINVAGLERVALQELRDTNTPGAAVAIVRGGKIVLARGFGIASIETGEQVTPDMLFIIGSTTKMFTAAALLTMAEEGRLRLDEPIGRYLPGLFPKVARVTAGQLLSNTGGLSDGFERVGPADDSALVRTVRSYGDDYAFLEPGSIFSYSNPGFALAGAVIEAVGGKPFARVIEERLLVPLGMSRSTFDPTVAMTFPRSQGHSAVAHERPEVVRPVVSHPAGWPTGGLFTNVYGLARFAVALMDSGRFEGRQVIPRSVVVAMAQTHSAPTFRSYKVNNFTFENEGYGYGSILYDLRGVQVVGHNGDVPGFGSLLRTVPAHRVAVIVLTNRSGMWLNRTAEKAMELVLPLSPRPVAITRSLPMSAAEMAEYAGVYRARRRQLELSVESERLVLREGERPVTAVKIGDLRFRLTSDPAVARPGTVLPADDPAGPASSEFVLLRDAAGRIGFLHLQARAYRRETAPTRPVEQRP